MIREVIQSVNKHSQWPDNHPSFSVCFLELFQTMRGETEADTGSLYCAVGAGVEGATEERES